MRDAAVQKIICSATMRAFNLDTADGNFDGKISSNVWNDYAKKNGLTEIEENATKDLKSAKEEILQNLCKMHGITQEELEKAQKELQKNRSELEQKGLGSLEDIKKDLEEKKNRFLNGSENTNNSFGL